MNRHTEGAVLITGAGSGIGAASAWAFADAGRPVAVTDIDPEAAEAVAAQLRSNGADAIAIELDVAQESAWLDAVEQATSALGPIRTTHANAASFDLFARDREVLEIEVDAWDATFEVSVRGALLAAKHTVPGMIDDGGGALIVTSSVKGLTGSNLRPAYSAAKAAVHSLVTTVATTYGPQGIRCNAVAPGIVETPAFAQLPVERQKLLVDSQLLPFVIQPKHIADAVVFLASNAAAAITGQVIVVDAGLTAFTPFLTSRSPR